MRPIPPIQCLVTFELLARLRSASRTADELCVTVSAVSHRIRQLEAHLGFKLFARGDFTLTADGTAINLANGIQKASYRESLSHPTPVVPGQIYQYKINVWPTSNLFKPGHRIRLEISSSLADAGSQRRRADPEMKFTATSRTPGTRASERCSAIAQLVHHIPLTASTALPAKRMGSRSIAAIGPAR